jgi:hypothetical protein
MASVRTTRIAGGVFPGTQLEQTPALGARFHEGQDTLHATLTETLRAIDGRALADALGAVCLVEGGDQRHIAIDGKTMRASKDGDGNATHVLSAFCAGLQSILGNEASRGKGMEIPDALKLLDRLDLKGRIVTGDAMLCPEIDRGKDRRKGGRLRLAGQGQSKEPAGEYPNGFRRAGFPPGLV